MSITETPNAKRSLSQTLTRLRYRFIPDHLIGEILSKSWVDNVAPLFFLIFTIGLFGALIPNFFDASSLGNTARQLGEFGFIVIAMMIVMVAGGIDLSVGSNFALGNFVALASMSLLELPVGAALALTVAATSMVGLFNGVLIGLLKLRAFLTTLVTLIIVRAIVELLLMKYAVAISGVYIPNDVWDFIGFGDVYGIPTSFTVLVVAAIIGHFILSRTRPGWRVMAVGGSRRSAHNSGISVPQVVCLSYVASGALVGIAAFMFAARISSAGADVGVGIEVSALTAAILGGNSLGGGRGSTGKALMGAATVLIITNGVVRLGMQSGSGNLVLGMVLLLAATVDVRWLKNRHKLLSKVYVAPTWNGLPACPPTAQGSGSPYEVNDKLADVSLIGLEQVEGPEDVIFDDDDNLYCGTRHGDIMRFRAPRYDKAELFAHIGGFPLGMAFDAEGNLYSCVGGMGLYRVAPDGTVSKATDQTRRSLFSVIDDSRLRLADDLDIAPDGKVYFSEATIRYEMHDWPVDSLEGRGNGRIICYDPKTGTTSTIKDKLRFPNGICTSFDGTSILFAETWGARISRLHVSGPKKGQTETVIDSLPGYPDNINRASDGNYWLALVGMRSPAVDLAFEMPEFRKRMSRRISHDEWLYPNINSGCVVKFSEAGEILDVLWDLKGKNHPMITSMREHKGSLYLGGISNNRIGRYEIEGADVNWTGSASYWSKK